MVKIFSKDKKIKIPKVDSDDYNEELADLDNEIEDTLGSPFDPKSISIKTKIVSLDQVLRRIKQQTIRLAPGFQRGYVWDSKRSSRLIESLMLKIPLQMFYVAANENDEWDVVDGVQRLSTIKNFILGDKNDGKGFTLKDLEFWGEKFDHQTFHTIASDPVNSQIINNIMETELNFTIIDSNTPEQVKRNIFKRINTGGMPLTVQEIRHALYEGKSTDLLKELVEEPLFKSITSNKINDKRMLARESILRMLAFTIRDHNAYNGRMDTFLSDTMRIINRMPNPSASDLEQIFETGETFHISLHSIDEIKLAFHDGLFRSAKLFNDHAFKKSLPDFSKKQSPINKSLLETWGSILAKLDNNQFEQLLKKRNLLFKLYLPILESPEFGRAISKDPAAIPSVRLRYNSLNEIVKKCINN